MIKSTQNDMSHIDIYYETPDREQVTTSSCAIHASTFSMWHVCPEAALLNQRLQWRRHGQGRERGCAAGAAEGLAPAAICAPGVCAAVVTQDGKVSAGGVVAMAARPARGAGMSAEG